MSSATAILMLELIAQIKKGSFQMAEIPRYENSPRKPDFDVFVEIMRILRAPGGCPWDIKQTHHSIAKNMIEEAYEAVDAIESNDIEHLKEELGDVLEQVVLHAQIASDNGEFDITDVIQGISQKMIRRHPHVFGDIEDKPENPDEVLNLWDQVKLEEQKSKHTEDKRAGLLDSVPNHFPALMQAQKISRKAVSAGFEWNSMDDVWDKVAEEIQEFKDAPQGSLDQELEFGDVLFTLVNVARKSGIDAEAALKKTNQKFKRRWSIMEEAAWESGREIQDLSIDEQEQLWQLAKKKENA